MAMRQTIKSAVRTAVVRLMPGGVKKELRSQLNRLPLYRERAAAGYRARNVSSPLFPSVRIDDVVDGVKSNGLFRGLHLPEAALAELLAYANVAPVYGDRLPEYGFLVENRARAERAAGKSFGLACYFNTFDDCAAARALSTDPLLTEIAMRYVGPDCKSFGTTMWWLFPVQDVGLAMRDHYAQRFHYDLDARRFIKFFFYLNDVGLDSGPHVFVEGTHRNKRARHVWPKRRLDDDDVERAYGKDRVLYLTGAAGDGFAEDTFGLHKGTVPTQRPRLCLQLEYGIASDACRIDACDAGKLKRVDVD